MTIIAPLSMTNSRNTICMILPGIRFSVVLSSLVLIVLLMQSCGDSDNNESKDSNKVDTAPKSTPPPFTIDVIPGFHVEEDVTMVGRSYHYRSDDLSNKTDELGVYVGNLPDTSSPGAYSAKREYRDSFYGDSANWREFIMADYTFREVVVAKDSENKLHSWCYSKDSVMLEKLTNMMKSIR